MTTMDRRTFNNAVGLGAMDLMLPNRSMPLSTLSQPQSTPETVWPSTTYRRFSVDMHVPDWDRRLLGHFDSVQYVANIARAGFQSLKQMANSHVGLCLWRTKVGQRHSNMHGRDFFGEIVDQCRRHKIHPIAYFSLIFDCWNFDHHPDWRIVPAEGENGILKGRPGIVCPNSPYRDYVLACIEEIVGNYDINGIFFDMTFWPRVCYCAHCTERFWREHQAEPPRTVDWNDPLWRTFQRAREQWLLDFAMTLTKRVKKVRPITAQHQYSTIFHNWEFAVPLELREACDYVGGDFYGGPTQQSLVCKAYNGLTLKKPFEFHTSRTTPGPQEAARQKPMVELQVESGVATIHSAALELIDYIHPDGTLNPKVYTLLDRLNTERQATEPYLGGELLADVGIYYDKKSMYNPSESGVPITELRAANHCPHLDAVIGAAGVLRKAHIPYGMITNVTLDQLNNYRAVMLPNVLEMTEEEAAQFRNFVKTGGVVYASGPSSLNRLDEQGPRFLLEDVLGVRYKGTLGTRITYLTPKDTEMERTIWPQDNFDFEGPMIHAENLPGSDVLATVTLPFVSPEAGNCTNTRFAQIWQNPPALEPGSNPGIVANRYGKGQSIWVAAPIESKDWFVNFKLTSQLLRRVLPKPFWFELEANPAVEMTLLHQADKNRFLVGFLNLEQEIPPIPTGVTARVRVPSEHRATRVVCLREQKTIPFKIVGPYVEFRVDPYEVVAMVVVEYR